MREGSDHDVAGLVCPEAFCGAPGPHLAEIWTRRPVASNALAPFNRALSCNAVAADGALITALRCVEVPQAWRLATRRRLVPVLWLSGALRSAAARSGRRVPCRRRRLTAPPASQPASPRSTRYRKRCRRRATASPTLRVPQRRAPRASRGSSDIRGSGSWVSPWEGVTRTAASPRHRSAQWSGASDRVS